MVEEVEVEVEVDFHLEEVPEGSMARSCSSSSTFFRSSAPAQLLFTSCSLPA